MTPSRAEILTFAAQGSGIYGKPCGHISGRKMVCCSFLSRWRIKLVTRIACYILLLGSSVFVWWHRVYISATICWIWSLIACTAQKNETAGCGHPADSDRHGGSYRSAPGRVCTCPFAAQRIHGHSFGVLDAHRTLQFAAETPFFPGLAHAGKLVFPATRGRSASRAGQCFDFGC